MKFHALSAMYMCVSCVVCFKRTFIMRNEQLSHSMYCKYLSCVVKYIWCKPCCILIPHPFYVWIRSQVYKHQKILIENFNFPQQKLVKTAAKMLTNLPFNTQPYIHTCLNFGIKWVQYIHLHLVHKFEFNAISKECILYFHSAFAPLRL